MIGVCRHHVATFFCIAGVLLSGCAIPPTTTFVRVPERMIADPAVRTLERLTPSCINPEKLARVLNAEESFVAGFGSQWKAFHDVIVEVLVAEEVTCPQTPARQWNVVKKGLLADHQGLIDKKASFPEDFRQKLHASVTFASEISVSVDKPGSLSLSTRPLPAEQEPGGVFAGLKERAQAAIIAYAEKHATIAGSTSRSKPEDAATTLLETLSPAREPRIAETQKVELTISAAVNSASVDDRFEYITAYLKVPAMPGQVNGRVSLEQVLVDRLVALVFARPEYQRIPCEGQRTNGCVDRKTWEDFVTADTRRAMDGIRVRIEVIDPLDTKAASVELGKLTSQAGAGLEATQTLIGELSVTKVAPSFSASREDTLKRELDKRTAWISPERSLLRITQRGLREATISGTISSALTLKIPKESLFVFKVTDQDVTKKNGLRMLKLKNVEQPLYAAVDSLGVALGTVRVAVPSAYPFRKEPDGISTTVIGTPVVLQLWKNNRILYNLEFQDLNPALRGQSEGLRALGFKSTLPLFQQLVVFQELEDGATFTKDLADGKLRLKPHPDPAQKGWYVIGDSDVCKTWVDKQGVQQILLGIENEHGVVGPFNVDQSRHLASVTCS